MKIILRNNKLFLFGAALVFPLLGSAETEIPVEDTGISDVERGTINANTGTAKIWKYGDNITIRTTGTQGHNGGLYSNLAGGLIVGDNLIIETSGEAADGIRTNPAGGDNWMDSTGSITVGNKMKITTSGVSADAINLNGRASLVAGDDCEIVVKSTASGGTWGLERAYAIRASHQATIVIGERLVVKTENVGGYAIYGSKSTDSTGTTIDPEHPNGVEITIGDGAKLSTFASSARGVSMDHGQVVFLGKLEVATEGNSAYAAYAGAKGQIEFNGETDLVTLGNSAHGIYLTSADSAVRFNSADVRIITSGNTAHGLSVNSAATLLLDGTTGNFLPEITVFGTGSAALHASGTGAKITLAGSESLSMAATQGTDSWGAWAITGGEVAFSESSSTGGTALKATGGSASGIPVISLAGNADAAGSHVQLDGYGRLDISGVNTFAAIGSLGGASANASVALGNRTLRVGQNNLAGNGSLRMDTSFAGAISGTGGLAKVGEGKLTLTGVSNFGALHVQAGILAVASTGSVTLGGNAAVDGGATLYVGGNLESVALTLQAAATVVLESAAARIHTQGLDLSGLSAGQKVGIEILDLGSLSIGDSREVFSFDSVAGYYGEDLDANDYFSLVGGNENYVFQWSADGHSLLVTAVPEPGTYALTLGALALGVLAIRRRK